MEARESPDVREALEVLENTRAVISFLMEWLCVGSFDEEHRLNSDASCGLYHILMWLQESIESSENVFRNF